MERSDFNTVVKCFITSQLEYGTITGYIKSGKL